MVRAHKRWDAPPRLADVIAAVPSSQKLVAEALRALEEMEVTR
jgi:hypothetical protein